MRYLELDIYTIHPPTDSYLCDVKIRTVLWTSDGAVEYIHCVSKNIPDIFDCNLEINYQFFKIFGTNFSDTTCH